MPRPIKTDAEALKVAERLIIAQSKLLSAYRIGTSRTPGTAIDTISREMPRFTAYITRDENA